MNTNFFFKFNTENDILLKQDKVLKKKLLKKVIFNLLQVKNSFLCS